MGVTMQRKGHVRTQHEDAHQPAEEGGLGKSQTRQHLDRGWTVSPGTMRKSMPGVQAAQSAVFRYDGQTDRQP